MCGQTNPSAGILPQGALPGDQEDQELCEIIGKPVRYGIRPAGSYHEATLYLQTANAGLICVKCPAERNRRMVERKCATAMKAKEVIALGRFARQDNQEVFLPVAVWASMELPPGSLLEGRFIVLWEPRENAKSFPNVFIPIVGKITTL